jgi:REP element-mobilizing transposase RayT
MTLFNNKYRIESTRLQGYDYSLPGAYFVTACTRNRECLFSDIDNGQIVLNELGKIVLDCWNDLPNHYSDIILDAFVVMPNHIHGIIGIDNGIGIVETGFKPVSTPASANTTTKLDKHNNHGLSEFVRALKTFSSRRINTYRQTPGYQVWQSRFHEHIIRGEEELTRIREYIVNNPQRWAEDANNPANLNLMKRA